MSPLAAMRIGATVSRSIFDIATSRALWPWKNYPLSSPPPLFSVRFHSLLLDIPIYTSDFPRTFSYLGSTRASSTRLIIGEHRIGDRGKSNTAAQIITAAHVGQSLHREKTWDIRGSGYDEWIMKEDGGRRQDYGPPLPVILHSGFARVSNDKISSSAPSYPKFEEAHNNWNSCETREEYLPVS